MYVELQNLENPRETDAFVSALNSLLVGRSPLHLLVSAKTECPDGSGDYSPYMETPITAAVDFGNDSITLQYSNRKGNAEKTELMFKENND